MQRTVEPPVSAPRGVRPLQHRAVGAIDVIPDLAAYGTIDRRIRHARGDCVIIIGADDERRLAAPGKTLHEGAYLARPKEFGGRMRFVAIGVREQQLRRDAGSLAPVKLTVEGEPFDFPGLSGDRPLLLRRQGL